MARHRVGGPSLPVLFKKSSVFWVTRHDVWTGVEAIVKHYTAIMVYQLWSGSDVQY